jgi:hypothetical protein
MRSQTRVQSPACLIIMSGREGVEVVPVVASAMAGMVDDESVACGCEGGLAALGLGGCELPAVGFFENNGLFRFSLAQAFLYVILGKVGLRKRRNIHAGPVHTELLQQRGCTLAARCLHRSVYAVSKGFEPSREEGAVTYHGHRRGVGGTSS